MNLGRRFWLVLAMAVSSTGCRTASTGTFSLFPRTPLMQAGLVDVEEFVAKHNRNAESIQSLEAKPAIKVARRVGGFHLDGRMALERPRNFRLDLSAMGKTQADIGSNDQEFWFWVATDTALYWCNYADLDSSALALTYQPDWIIEAMGLKPISPIEARQIQPKKGPDRDTTTLVFPVTRSGSETYRRWLIVSNRELRIKQLQIWTAKEPAVLIAQADPSKYQDFPLKPDAAGTRKETCYLPQNLVLEWKRDQPMKLEVEMLEVALNQFDPTRRAAVFTEPEIPGYERKNLAELGRARRPEGHRASTRRTMPAPSSRTGVELGQPAPLTDDDGPVVPKLGRSTAPASATPPPELPTLQALVGSPMPSAPESPGTRAARADLDPPTGLTIER